MAGMVYGFATGYVVRFDGDGRESGWVDPWWSRTELFDSRNDVPAIVKEYEDSEDLYDYVRDALADHLGAYEDSGNGSFYSADDTQDVETGDYWSYAVHFKVKSHGPNGWTEQAWVPDVSKL